MDQIENEPELQVELVENADVEDENEKINKWLSFAVLIIWIISFLMFWNSFPPFVGDIFNNRET